MAKYRLTRELLAAGGRYRFEEAPLAEPETIALVHDRAYVNAFLEGSLDPQTMRRIGFPWSEGLVRRTLASVGGTLAASADALAGGFGGTLAGGTHHASRDTGSGFCVFNDIAVAVLSLRARGLARRAAVVDLDVHQGDGTALIFAGDGDVLTVRWIQNLQSLQVLRQAMAEFTQTGSVAAFEAWGQYVPKILSLAAAAGIEMEGSNGR